MNSNTLKISWILYLVLISTAGAYSDPDDSSKQNQVPSTHSKVLYGRIEEITGSKGAKIPIELHALVPKLDNSKSLKANVTEKAAGSNVVQSFPFDWQGSWKGILKVYSDEFSSLGWQSDPEEVKKEQELLHPGAGGQVVFEFTQSANRVNLQPAQVIFSVPMKSTRYADQLAGMLGGVATDEQSKIAIANMLNSFPVYYALHLGNLYKGIGVSGNTLQSKVVRNEVRELLPGVLEQQVITYNADQHLQSGRTTYGYSESVVRFYKRSSTRLAVQVAVVNYYSDGRFLNKVILAGDVDRGASSGSIENYFYNGQPAVP